jgi:hypothetical protein
VSPAELPEPQATERQPADPVGVAAIVSGCIGLVAFGIVLALVTAVLAAIAGQRAREARRSAENAYIGLGLAALDGIVWIVLHLVFDLKFIAG